MEWEDEHRCRYVADVGLEIKSVPDGSTDALDSQHLLHIIGLV